MTTPIVPCIRYGMILRAVKAVLLDRMLSDVYLHAVNINNEVARYEFDSNGEVLFGSFVPVGIWLNFNQFTVPELPEVKIVFSGDQISI